MAKIISVGNLKGGSGKSTTSGVLAYLLSKNSRVLAIDTDGQGNLTQLLTGIEDIYEFQGSTIWNVYTERTAKPFIRVINENLHIIAGDQDINTLGTYFYIELPRLGIPYYQLVLKEALDELRDMYDYIIIDNPPALGELSICNLSASDYVIVSYETSKFCYSSLQTYLSTIESVRQNLNPNIKIAGIARAIMDSRRLDNQYYSEIIEKNYPDWCFKTVIKRSAYIGRLPAYGFEGNPEMKYVKEIYNPLIKELCEIVG